MSLYCNSNLTVFTLINLYCKLDFVIASVELFSIYQLFPNCIDFSFNY